MGAETGKLIPVTDSSGSVIAGEWLLAAESVHRQLRPQLPDDYRFAMERVFAGGGRMVVLTDAQKVLGLAVWRVFADTFSGLKFYVDDLVIDEASRSLGAGHKLVTWLEQEARTLGAGSITLDSGTQRTRAHRFYFREGFVITSFNFKKQLS
ncbi:GNAT family N-acetyltransferase [Niveibacterium terrae]|uniref:GNAT family N-acetyltransferase n=1 Tax=Niveibacterium terrae TaxID=3373598 RepID=UPI003A9479E4